MGRRNKDKDPNATWDPTATPQQKADEFDRGYSANRTYTNAPNADAAGVEKPKGRHRK
jgi:hypothetical protein